ncbi:MAG: DUF7119 family protein [Halapricum sp.]
MPPEGPDPPADRESPVGAPVIRGDPELTGQKPDEAVQFDPDDPDSVAQAAETVAAFANNTAGDANNVYVLRGAAACAALVRGEGSYKAAAERAGSEATVAFIRKWSRVHDLPEAIRRYVARGEIAPTAAKHIARVSGIDRYLLAWATLDHDLTVREVRSTASLINDGETVDAALAAETGTKLGRLTIELPVDSYLCLRRQASLSNVEPGAFLAEVVEYDDPSCRTGGDQS